MGFPRYVHVTKRNTFRTNPLSDTHGPFNWSTIPPQSSHTCGTPERLHKLYQQQLNNVEYRKLIEQNIIIFGTFDGKSLPEYTIGSKSLQTFSYFDNAFQIIMIRSRLRM